MAGDRLFGLGGKLAAVIGAGSGIGQAVALGCARQGATVRCLDIDVDAATETAETIAANGDAADAGLLDVTDARSVDDALDGVVERHLGPILFS